MPAIRLCGDVLPYLWEWLVIILIVVIWAIPVYNYDVPGCGKGSMLSLCRPLLLSSSLTHTHLSYTLSHLCIHIYGSGASDHSDHGDMGHPVYNYDVPGCGEGR